MHINIIILCLVTVPGIFCYKNIHKFMTIKEVHAVFNTRPDSVPEYEVVKVHLSAKLRKRDLSFGKIMRVKAFGQNIKLWLEPTDKVLLGEETPVYYATPSADGNVKNDVRFIRIENPLPAVSQFFKNQYENAFFTVRRYMNNSAKMNGFIASRHIVIRSIPEHVIHKFMKNQNFVTRVGLSVNSSYHVVYRRTFVDDNINALIRKNTALLGKMDSSASRIPHILYPEILVFVDNSMYRDHGSNTYVLLEYLVTLWNGVDLYFRSLENPSVRLHISAIVISIKCELPPYIWNHMLNNDTFDAIKAQSDSQHFFYLHNQTFPFDSYDMAITLTTNYMNIGQTLKGITYDTACIRNDETEEVKSVAMIYDDGAFNAIRTVAHEIGHLMRANHDDNEICTYNDGFIMAPQPSPSTNTSDFSICSILSFQDSLRNNQLNCFYNNPKQDGRSLPILLPGMFKLKTGRCETLGFGQICNPHVTDYDKQCTHLYCYNDKIGCQKVDHHPLDGSKCGPDNGNKFCLHQKCVSLDD